MIHIFYRHSQNASPGRGRPEWFNYVDCFENLEKTISSRTDVDVTLVYDGDTPNTDDVVKKLNSSSLDFNLLITHHNSSLLSYRDLLSHIKNKKDIKDGDLIYFLENDYLHKEGWVDVVNNLYHTYDMSTAYVSLYDHNDKYTHPMYNDLVSKIFTTSKCHWRTVPSTCGSFIISKKLFDLDYDIWSTAVGDHNTFLHLNNTRNRFVFTPIPGLSTHCMEGLMSPTVNWSKI
tara:strand:- start:50 stop:745 length:696 start_codon:yes stop_codon:yes gene_type:complete